MLKQLIGSILMETLKPGCPRNVVERLSYHDFIPNPLGPSARLSIKDTRCKVWGHEYHSK